jgi:putative ATP-dependent endonuclease of OLD family
MTAGDAAEAVVDLEKEPGDSGPKMEVSSLKIENYRGIETLEIDLDPSTVLIGPNNVGKTSVLRALDTVLGRYTGRGGRVQDYDHRRKDSDRDLLDGHQVTITATFVEQEDRSWSVSAAQALNDAIQLDDDGRRSVVARLRDTYDARSREFDQEFAFLNSAGDPLPIKLQERVLREFVPVFYLSPERSAGSDFRGGARFWAPFLRDPVLSEDERKALEEKLREIGAEVTATSPGLAEVRGVMEGVKDMIELNEQEPVSLEPLPARLPDVLRQTEVRLTGPTGASVALDRHGGGAQNVA